MTKSTRTTKTIFVAFAKLLAAGSGLLIAVALSKLFPDEADYATYRQTLLTFQFVAPLLGLGLSTAALYFISRQPDRAAAIVVEMFLLLFAAGGVFAAVLVLGGARWIAYRFNNPDLEQALYVFSTYAIFALPVTLVGPIFVAREESTWVAGHSGLIGLLKILCVILPILLIGKNPMYAVQGIMVWAIIAFVVSAYALWYKLPPLQSRLSTASLKSLCAYGIPLSIASVIANINRNVDKVLVSDFLDPKEAAVFMNGAIEIPLIGIVVGSVSSILAAEFSAKYEIGKVDEIMKVWQKAVIKTAAILFPVGAFLFVYAETTMVLLFDERYIASSEPFRIYLYLLPLRVFQGGLFLQMAGKTRVLLYFSIIVTVCNAGLTYWLVPLLGMNGAAYATVISVGLLGFPLGLWMTQRMLGIAVYQWIPYLTLISFLLVSVALFVVAKFVCDWCAIPELWAFFAVASLMPVSTIAMLRWNGMSLFRRGF